MWEVYNPGYGVYWIRKRKDKEIENPKTGGIQDYDQLWHDGTIQGNTYGRRLYDAWNDRWNRGYFKTKEEAEQFLAGWLREGKPAIDKECGLGYYIWKYAGNSKLGFKYLTKTNEWSWIGTHSWFDSKQEAIEFLDKFLRRDHMNERLAQVEKDIKLLEEERERILEEPIVKHGDIYQFCGNIRLFVRQNDKMTCRCISPHTYIGEDCGVLNFQYYNNKVKDSEYKYVGNIFDGVNDGL